MNPVTDKSQIRTYRAVECITFRSTKEKFGGLSNMAGGFPLRVSGILVPSAEALYQASRFPNKPEIQKLIIEQQSPMTAKMVSKPYRNETRPDWQQIRVRVMRWVLRVKLAMHWPEFCSLLLDTGDRLIVEDSRRDNFWGALRQDDGTLVGMNVLGRLLMELRDELKGPNKEALRIVNPPPISDFNLLGQPIGQVGFGSKGIDTVDPDLRAKPGSLWDMRFEEPEIDENEESVTTVSTVANEERIRDSKNKDNMTRYPKRLIEVDLPIKRISEHARKDQNIKKGHLHSMHVWWATRPLASCRAVIMATLLPDSADERCSQFFRDEAKKILQPFTRKNLADPIILRHALLEFIADFASWDAGVNPTYLNAARKLVAAAHLDGSPLVLDPFAGAGSIPFEALRVGAQTFSGDLNPVAVLLNKVSQEYLPKYGHRLAEGVEKWGKWLLEQSRKKLSPFYPADDKGNIPLAYIWARTIKCEGPGCGAKVPLLGMLWLSHKANNRAALRYHGNQQTKEVVVEVFSPRSEGELQPSIVNRFSATCPVCGYTTPYKNVRTQLQKLKGGARSSRLLAVVTASTTGKRTVRLPNEADNKAIESAKLRFNELETQVTDDISLIPNEPTLQYSTFVNRANIYGIPNWGYLFTERQIVSLVSFTKIILEANQNIVSESSDEEYARAITTCLSLAVSNCSHYNTSVSFYGLDHMISCYIQGCGFPMRPDFGEANPTMPKFVGGLEYSLQQIIEVLNREGSVIQTRGTVQRASAMEIPLPDDSVPYVITDPPYYYTIQYADSSDLPYVWLKRMLKRVHPDLFQFELTPKEDEIIVQSPSEPSGEGYKNSEKYERNMKKALSECRRVLAESGIAVVLFAHKETSGWEALLSALVGAGWTVTASWPIDTERAARLRAGFQAMLASSVFLVCRPRETSRIGDWRDVLAELPKRIHDWLPRLDDEGIVGADAIFACLGPALEIFSRYSKVEKASGEQVFLRDYLEQVWAAVAREALGMIFEGADASGFEEDARLTAMWLWTLHAGNGNGKTEKVFQDKDSEEQSEIEIRKSKITKGYALEYDAARKIAQGLGVHLEKLGSVVEIRGDTARLLSVVERTKHLFGKEQGQSPVSRRKRKDRQIKFDFAREIEEAEKESGGWGEKTSPPIGNTVLDQLHQAMILFAAGRSEALKRFLVEDGVGKDGRFWRLGQALSALYPKDSEEKRWVDGILARKKGLGF